MDIVECRLHRGLFSRVQENTKKYVPRNDRMERVKERRNREVRTVGFYTGQKHSVIAYPGKKVTWPQLGGKT